MIYFLDYPVRELRRVKIIREMEKDNAKDLNLIIFLLDAPRLSLSS